MDPVFQSEFVGQNLRVFHEKKLIESDYNHLRFVGTL